MPGPTTAGRATVPVVTREAVERALRGRRLDVKGRLFEAGLLLTLLISLAVLVTLLVDVVTQGWGVFEGRGADFVTSRLSASPERAGVWQGLWGSLLLMAFVAAIAFPLGIGAAVYLEEYAHDTPLTRFINANIRNLAGVPAIVYGLLGLAIFVKALRGLTGGSSIVSGGLTLAVLVLPIVIITSSEALRAVPNGIREAGHGVGATKWEVVRSHVLPSAAPGILTGTILSLARAFGETAPLILVGAVTGFFATGSGSVIDRLQGKYTALPTIVFDWSRQPSAGVRQNAAAAIVVLMALILAVNATAILLRTRYERRW
jgi:phosphate transport system permease protein